MSWRMTDKCPEVEKILSCYASSSSMARPVVIRHTRHTSCGMPRVKLELEPISVGLTIISKDMAPHLQLASH
jgi:hypothetical protein